MSNSTACAATSNCTIIDGATTNGTFEVTGYNPHAPVPYWHQRMELATICVFNSLSLIIIVARLWYRWTRLNRFRSDDRWIAAAGLFLIGYTVSQVGTNIYGGGLHMDNVPDAWLEWHWHFSLGWAGYYVVTSCIKISVCFTFLEILPHHLKALRYTVFGLAAVIASLGIMMTFGWLFSCTPVISNFVWSVDSTSCINYDIFRWLWIALSLPIDFLILAVPLQLLKRTRIRQHERKILRLVFSANLLGTLTCAFGIYGVYENRITEANDGFYHETLFMMTNDLEMFMYALGACFPVLSKHLVARSDPSRATHSSFSSWARHLPNLFLPNKSPPKTHQDSALAAWKYGSQVSVKGLKSEEWHDRGQTFDHEIEISLQDASLQPSHQQASMEGEGMRRD